MVYAYETIIFKTTWDIATNLTLTLDTLTPFYGHYDSLFLQSFWNFSTKQKGYKTPTQNTAYVNFYSPAS